MYERLSMERVVVLLLAVVRRQQRHSRSAAEEGRGGEATLLLLLLLLLLLASLKRSKMVVVLCAGQPMVRSLTLHSHVLLLVAEEVALEWVLRRRLELVPWQLQVRQAEEAVVCEHQPLQPQAQQV